MLEVDTLRLSNSDCSRLLFTLAETEMALNTEPSLTRESNHQT